MTITERPASINHAMAIAVSHARVVMLNPSRASPLRRSRWGTLFWIDVSRRATDGTSPMEADYEDFVPALERAGNLLLQRSTTVCLGAAIVCPLSQSSLQDGSAARVTRSCGGSS
jgi:hypothetical protein